MTQKSLGRFVLWALLVGSDRLPAHFSFGHEAALSAGSGAALPRRNKPGSSSSCSSRSLSDNANPPVKFDLARKVRVFNARFEFVEFELHGLSLSRKRVPIPSDLMGLAKDSNAQRLLRSSFQLIDENSDVSVDRVTSLKQFIVKKYLINLPYTLVHPCEGGQHSWAAFLSLFANQHTRNWNHRALQGSCLQRSTSSRIQ
jgi:hypothetical protein